MSKKILQIDEARFIALAELGMPVFWNWPGCINASLGVTTFEYREPSEELEEYLQANADSKEKRFTFWTLVESTDERSE